MKRDLLSKYIKALSSCPYPSHVVMARIVLKTFQKYGLLDIYLTEVFKQRTEEALQAKLHYIFDSSNYRHIDCSTIIDRTLTWDKTSQGSHFWDNFYVCATQQAKDIKKYFYQIYKIWDTVTTAKKKSKVR